MPKNKRRASFRDFESRKPNSPYYRITVDMIKSDAWKDLTLSQRGLYQEFKSEYVPFYERRGIRTPANDKNILFPVSRWEPLYKGNRRAWQRDLNALIDHGFIKIEESGWTTRTPSVYSLSADWHNWKKNAK